MLGANGLLPDDIGYVWFTVTEDLDAAFPADAARAGLGWTDVPLICGREIPVPGALGMCVRVLIAWNTSKSQKEIRHAFLRGAKSLRPAWAVELPNTRPAERRRLVVMKRGASRGRSCGRRAHPGVRSSRSRCPARAHGDVHSDRFARRADAVESLPGVPMCPFAVRQSRVALGHRRQPSVRVACRSCGARLAIMAVRARRVARADARDRSASGPPGDDPARGVQARSCRTRPGPRAGLDILASAPERIAIVTESLRRRRRAGLASRLPAIGARTCNLRCSTRSAIIQRCC